MDLSPLPFKLLTDTSVLVLIVQCFGVEFVEFVVLVASYVRCHI